MDQTALYIVGIVILAGSLATFVVQFVRMQRRDRDDEGPDRGGPPDGTP